MASSSKVLAQLERLALEQREDIARLQREQRRLLARDAAVQLVLRQVAAMLELGALLEQQLQEQEQQEREQQEQGQGQQQREQQLNKGGPPGQQQWQPGEQGRQQPPPPQQQEPQEPTPLHLWREQLSGLQEQLGALSAGHVLEPPVSRSGSGGSLSAGRSAQASGVRGGDAGPGAASNGGGAGGGSEEGDEDAWRRPFEQPPLGWCPRGSAARLKEVAAAGEMTVEGYRQTLLRTQEMVACLVPRLRPGAPDREECLERLQEAKERIVGQGPLFVISELITPSPTGPGTGMQVVTRPLTEGAPPSAAAGGEEHFRFAVEQMELTVDQEDLILAVMDLQRDFHDAITARREQLLAAGGAADDVAERSALLSQLAGMQRTYLVRVTALVLAIYAVFTTEQWARLLVSSWPWVPTPDALQGPLRAQSEARAAAAAARRREQGVAQQQAPRRRRSVVRRPRPPPEAAPQSQGQEQEHGEEEEAAAAL